MDIKFNFQDTLQRLDKISSCIYVPGNKTIFPELSFFSIALIFRKLLPVGTFEPVNRVRATLIASSRVTCCFCCALRHTVETKVKKNIIVLKMVFIASFIITYCVDRNCMEAETKLIARFPTNNVLYTFYLYCYIPFLLEI